MAGDDEVVDAIAYLARTVPMPAGDEATMESESVRWPRTPSGLKVYCPECGASGYARGSWTHKHAHHTSCPICGKVVTTAGLGSHQRMHG